MAKTLYEILTMPNPRLRAGERTVTRQVKLPESLDRQLRARAVADGDLPLSEVIRAAIEAYLR